MINNYSSEILRFGSAAISEEDYEEAVHESQHSMELEIIVSLIVIVLYLFSA